MRRMIRREMWIHNYLFVLTAKSSLLISSWKSRILMKSKSYFNLHFSKIWILKKIHKSTFLNFCDKFEWNFANFLILFATKILRYPILTPKLEFWWKFANQLFWIFSPKFEWFFYEFLRPFVTKIVNFRIKTQIDYFSRIFIYGKKMTLESLFNTIKNTLFYNFSGSNSFNYVIWSNYALACESF